MSSAPEVAAAKPTAEELLAALVQAQRAHFDAERATAQARKVETDALNALNRAQREFDKALAELRAKAPRGSDWRSPPPPPRGF